MICVIDARYVQDHFPGIGRYTYNLIAALCEIAPQTQFVALHNPALRNTRYDVAALERYPNLTLRRIDISTFSPAEQFRLPFAIRRSEYALFHSPYYVKPYFLSVPSVVSIFDLLPLRYPEALPGRFSRFAFRWTAALAARTAAGVLAPSVSTQQDLVALLGVPQNKIHVVPLAADNRFAPQSAAEIERVRDQYNLPVQYVLSVSINKPHKNLAALLDAWRQVEGAARLVVAGPWDPRYPLAERAASDVVSFIHDVDDADLPALYAGAMIFVMPSLLEGFGLPALEAMACGTPVVCSNTSSLPEVVGDAAILVDPRQVDEIAAAIECVLCDAALRQELCGRSLLRASEFSWERTARETLRVYESLVKQGI